uniref:(northern house mosquito) hypothetical protein n=1 Tax=Culex pipiens TaxID=7175 RepID=A0A8D8NN15_CULPI
MPSYRQNSLVVDLNVLPSIPDIEIIRMFLTKDVALDFSKVRNLQLNISMNQVIIEMATPDQAAEIAGTHSAKHYIISCILTRRRHAAIAPENCTLDKNALLQRRR